MKIPCCCCLSVVLLLTASTARAQYWGGWNQGASTVAGSAAQGYADVIRAAGDYEVQDSIAANNDAQTRSLEIDNHKKAVETYFQLKEYNRQETQKLAGPPLTQEQAYQWAQAMAPTRPSPAKLDPVTGKIQWPIILRTAAYSEPCGVFDKAFAERASTGSMNGDQYAEVQTAHDTIVGTMTANASKYKDYDIIAAKNLVDGLTYEARFPAGQ